MAGGGRSGRRGAADHHASPVIRYALPGHTGAVVHPLPIRMDLDGGIAERVRARAPEKAERARKALERSLERGDLER